jgi:hypothetical protein
MQKVSGDLAEGGEYAESFGLSTLIGTICGNYLANNIVSWLYPICRTFVKPTC